jgi:hypothetical protein
MERWEGTGWIVKMEGKKTFFPEPSLLYFLTFNIKALCVSFPILIFLHTIKEINFK